MSAQTTIADKRGGRPTRVFRLITACHRHQNPRKYEENIGYGDGGTSNMLLSQPIAAEYTTITPPVVRDVEDINSQFAEAAETTDVS